MDGSAEIMEVTEEANVPLARLSAEALRFWKAREFKPTVEALRHEQVGGVQSLDGFASAMVQVGQRLDLEVLQCWG